MSKIVDYTLDHPGEVITGNKEVYGQELGGNSDEDETDNERSHAELAEDNNNYPPGYDPQ